MSAREEIATAASTVAGVTCTPRYRQTTKPGDAFVRLDALNRDDTGLGYMVAWQVCVLLPQTQTDAETWIDAHVDDLLEALEPEGAVTTARPVQLSLETGTLPALLVTLIRPKE